VVVVVQQFCNAVGITIHRQGKEQSDGTDESQNG